MGDSIGNEVPSTAAEIVALAQFVKNHRDPSMREPDSLIGYLVAHGVSRSLTKRCLTKVWPEAAAKVEYRAIDIARHFVQSFNYRLTVLDALGKAIKAGDVTERQSQELLEEWDAFHTPAQLPAPIRDAALKRLAAEGYL